MMNWKSIKTGGAASLILLSLAVGCKNYGDDIAGINRTLASVQKDVDALKGKVVKEFVVQGDKLILTFTDDTKKEIQVKDLARIEAKDNQWYLNGAPTGILTKGDKGDKGAQGIQGPKGDKGDNGAQGLKGEKGDTPKITISEDGYWEIDGQKTKEKARPQNGSVAFVDREDDGFMDLTFFDASGKKTSMTTFLRETARLTSVIVVPEANYKGWPAIKWNTTPDFLFEVKAKATPDAGDNGYLFKDAPISYTPNEDGTVSVSLRLNPSSFNPQYIKNIELKEKAVEILRAASEEKVLPSIIAPTNGDWKSVVKDGVLTLKLKDYLPNGDVRSGGEKIQLVQFAISTTKDNVQIHSDWAALYTGKGEHKQPDLYLDKKREAAQNVVRLPADQNVVLLPKILSKAKTYVAGSDEVLNIKVNTVTDLKQYLRSYFVKDAQGKSGEMNLNDYNAHYEFALMAYKAGGTGTDVEQNDYANLTKDGIVTPEYLGKKFSPVCVGKMPIVQVRLYMDNHLVALSYVKLNIVAENKEQAENISFEYYKNEGSAIQEYNPVFKTYYVCGSKDVFTTRPEWNNANILSRLGMGIEEFNTLYEFAGVADTQLFKKPGAAEKESIYIPADESLKNVFEITYGKKDAEAPGGNTISLTRTADSKCLKPGIYYTAVQFNQRADKATKAQPMHVAVYFKIEVTSPDEADIKKMAAKIDSYKMENLWDGNLIVAKGKPSQTPTEGFNLVLNSQTYFKEEGLSSYTASITKTAKKTFGEKPKYVIEIVSVEGGDADPKNYVVKMNSNGSDFELVRKPSLPSEEVVTVNYNITSELCPELTKTLFTFKIRFDHAAKYSLTGEFLKAPEGAKELVKFKNGKIYISDDKETVEVELLKALQLVSNDANADILYQNGIVKDYQILGNNPAITYEMNVENSYKTKGIAKLEDHKIIWDNIPKGNAVVVKPLDLKVTMTIKYGKEGVYTYKKVSVPVIVLPSAQFNNMK